MTRARPVLLIALGVALLLTAGRAGLAHRTNRTNAEVSVAGPLVSYRLTVSAHDLAVALGIPTDLVTPLLILAVAAWWIVERAALV